jgi:hypothetical protein
MEKTKATIPLLKRLIKAHTPIHIKKDTKKKDILKFINHYEIQGNGTDNKPYVLRYRLQGYRQMYHH